MPDDSAGLRNEELQSLFLLQMPSELKFDHRVNRPNAPVDSEGGVTIKEEGKTVTKDKKIGCSADSKIIIVIIIIIKESCNCCGVGKFV